MSKFTDKQADAVYLLEKASELSTRLTMMINTHPTKTTLKLASDGYAQLSVACTEIASLIEE